VVVLTCFVICEYVYVCVDFVMCVCVGIVMRECSDSCVGVLVIRVLVFTAFLYGLFYVYLFLFVTSEKATATE
jgi:hypothetical protein